jgi:hypothetical protein
LLFPRTIVVGVVLYICARALAYWHRRSKREEDPDRPQDVAFVNFRVGMATRSTVLYLYRSAHWHHSSEKFPRRTIELYLDIAVRAICRLGKLEGESGDRDASHVTLVLLLSLL